MSIPAITRTHSQKLTQLITNNIRILKPQLLRRWCEGKIAGERVCIHKANIIITMRGCIAESTGAAQAHQQGNRPVLHSHLMNIAQILLYHSGCYSTIYR